MAGPSNSIIITDPEYTDAEKEENLEQLERDVRAVLEGDDVSIHKLPFFKRVILVFRSTESSQRAFDKLVADGIKCGYSLRDNKFEAKREFLGTDGPAEDEPERMPENDEGALQVPPKVVQMQSPPPSPYEGWVNRPEDPPDFQTITDPKSMANILYEPGDQQKLQKVFKLDDLDLGEGIADDEPAIYLREDGTSTGAVTGTGTGTGAAMDTNDTGEPPIVMIDNEEAQHLREVARGEAEKRKKSL